VIRGNYYSALSDTTLPVYGSVDKETQRAAWTVGDRKEPIFEAGFANLTKSETTMLVHFGTKLATTDTGGEFSTPPCAVASGGIPSEGPGRAGPCASRRTRDQHPRGADEQGGDHWGYNTETSASLWAPDGGVDDG
jgi:hypothetical protein